MKLSEFLCNNNLHLRISSYTATTYRAESYWKDKDVELKRGCCVGGLCGTGNTIDNAVKNLISEVMTTHKIKVNKETQEESYYIDIANLHK